jgi:hypothetical protein
MKDNVLTPAQRRATEAARAGIRADPSSIRVRFPAAARTIARTAARTAAGPGGPGGGPDGLAQFRAEDQVRIGLLEAFAEATPVQDILVQEVEDLYRYGDADERRAVLMALSHLPIGDRGIELVRDALRSNDPRLVVAALGDYGRQHLDPPAWRQGVLKCLFMEVPLDLIHAQDHPDPSLREMVAAYAAERTAAGRPVPADARRILSTDSTETEP